MRVQPRIAYFSMEFALSADIPTYSGGLGALAADTVRAAADLNVPMVAVTLVHRAGYCRQILDADGNQTEAPVSWPVEEYLRPEPQRVSITLEGRDVVIRAWVREVAGYGGHRVPIYFLDTDLAENAETHRGLTHHLYGGDARYRLCQEALLGIGGVRMLRALGFDTLERFHMNEGHAALLACELLRESVAARGGDRRLTQQEIEEVRKHCVFTTHTPVPAGHDQFTLDTVSRVLDASLVEMLRQLSCVDGALNMTYLALHLSRYVNGVARRHGEISRQMYAPHAVDSITNGIHVRTWASPPIEEVLDAHLPTWREDSYSLRNALSVPNEEIWEAHRRCKQGLLNHVRQTSGVSMDPEVFTIGFARRAATYKRADLFFHDLDRLMRIHDLPGGSGRFQAILAGKAHPQDGSGKDMIRRVYAARQRLGGRISIVYLADYDLALCKLMVSGVDLWLNTPEPPLEASGTSGMKAAVNGVPSLSVLDGWWLEGWIEGVTGWAIGRSDATPGEPSSREKDAVSLYDKLEYDILPLYYRQRERYTDVMRHCIALNGSYFHAQRMMNQYVLKAYFC